MSTGLSVAFVAGAYLLGSISWSVLLVRLLQGMDVRSVGSGNAGATNVMRTAGKKAGAAVLVLDIGKGIAAVAVPRSLDAPPAVVGGAAVAVVLGHVFPVFFAFRGGKGVATSAGALGTLSPVAMALGLLVFVAIVTWKRYVSLGSVVTAALFPVFAWMSHRQGWTEHGGRWTILAGALIALLVLIKHQGNLRRLWRGTEPRLGEVRR
ncbi:MAG TPA: glycerol-3-phosphate 1-O-acyltransferase PlsY [Thermoanaerobaculia bacterium]|nr:glycerol-3-phosphate 1-O-acyltransferase PlsY [Thermoanaerobaculia bacterium]